MKFIRFVKILEANGFAFAGQADGSHAIYQGIVDGELRAVTVAAHRMSDDIKPGTQASMIRQSGLDKKHFR